MNKNNKGGFTIVELLIVIVVIAILATISIVAYNGIQQRADNTRKGREMVEWGKLFEAYNVVNGAYPLQPSSGTVVYCLGTGFPSGDADATGECRDYTASSGNVHQEEDNATLISELKTIGSSLPDGPKKPVNNAHVGPYVEISTTGYRITNFFNGGCPESTIQIWTNGNDLYTCKVEYNY